MRSTVPRDRWRLRGAPVDVATQHWVIRTGRSVSILDQPWLDGPVGSPAGIGQAWIDAHAVDVGADVIEVTRGGLVPDLSALQGPGVRIGDLHPQIRDFYEHTGRWELDLWSRWARWAEPGGRAINAVFSRRLRQLSLPLDPLEVAHGMTSRVLMLQASDGAHLGTVWQRTLRATGATVFSGCYGVTMLPLADRPSVRVAFPLPNGSITVLLRPEITPDGGLRLISPGGRFGAEGAYLVVRPRGAQHGWARRVPLPESFDVYVDRRGELRCDHVLRLGPAEMLRLHYRMRPKAAP